MSIVFVTGGAGYIGSHTCKELHRRNIPHVVLDSLEHGHSHNVKWGKFEKVDLRDALRLQELFHTYKPSAVIHFAAYAYVGESVSDPLKYYENNVSGTIQLLQAMKQANCRHLIFSSTCATYGIPDKLPITESTSQQPINPYGRSKWMVEKILEDSFQAYGISSVALRYFNASGADPEGDLGEEHHPETHLLPLAIDAVLGKNPKFGIFGDDYPTPDGTCIRDYIHVSDLADAHVRALDFVQNNPGFHAFNLGTGKGFSNREVVNTISKITQRPYQAPVHPRRPGDPPQLVADAAKARSLLGWEPKWKDISAHISHVLNWLGNKKG